MEEMHRTHKEPAWGWIGVVLTALADRPRPDPKRLPRPARPCPQ
jgi:hypothetical protein